MLDELEKIRCSLEEAIEMLREQLGPVLKESDPTCSHDEPCIERAPRSDACRRIETHADHLDRMRLTVISITDRLDVPT